MNIKIIMYNSKLPSTNHIQPNPTNLGLNNSTVGPTKAEAVRKYQQRRKYRKVIDSLPYRIFLFFFTFYVLFGDDLRHFMGNKSSDNVFYVITLFALIFFTMDIVLLCLLYKTYRWSLLFWLDAISTLSLIFDLGWLFLSFFENEKTNNYARIAKGSRSSLIALKISRYIQVMRYIRLIRITSCLKFKSIYSKMNKAFKKANENKKETKKSYNYDMIRSNSEISEEKDDRNDLNVYQMFFPDVKYFDKKEEDDEEDDIDHDQFDMNKQVKNSGEALSVANIQRVIIIVLILMMFIPIFTINTYYDDYTSYKSGLTYISYVVNNKGITEPGLKDLWNNYIVQNTDTSTPLLTLNLYRKVSSDEVTVVPGFTKSSNGRSEEEIENSYRAYELIAATEPDDLIALADGEYFVVALLDRTSIADKNAYINILRTLFSLSVFIIFALLFSRDANKLILEPMERMMRTIKRIKANPIQAAKDEEEKQFQVEEKIKNNLFMRRLHYEQKKYETNLLINILIRSGKLLAIGLGEAGTEIVINNLRQDKLNPLIKGQEVICLFGFCDIRGFVDINEKLGSGVLDFVNEVAKILHSVIDRFAGSTNKNLGNNFLVVWKFHEREIEDVIKYDDDGKEKIGKQLKSYPHENNPVTARCELAIVSFISIIASVNQSKTLEKYYKKGDNGSLLNSKIVMSFGLHMGWAFEGAIGSEHKIDVSYLSPNVNLASRLESSTKQYGTLLFVSGQVINRVSEDVRNQHRKIDVVNLKGSKEAMELWTYDLYTDVLEPTEIFEDQIYKISESNKKKSLIIDYRNKLKQFHDKVFNGQFSTKTLLINDKAIRKMRVKYKKDFFIEWENGFDAYIKGNWRKAKESFKITRDFFKDAYGIEDHPDGPSINLLNYMGERNTGPRDWEGVRKLLNK